MNNNSNTSSNASTSSGIRILKSTSEESTTIYPYKNGTKVEFQENVTKLALKSLIQHSINNGGNINELNFLFVSSAHVDNEYKSVSIIIEEFDRGVSKFDNSISPTVLLPDAIYIPSRLVHQANQGNDDSILNKSLLNESATYYFNAIKFLANYFLNLCTNIDSLNKILSLSSTILFSNNSTNNKLVILNSTFDLITLANYFEAQRIHPIPIIETSLLKTLQVTTSFYLKPKTGYCALYKNENIILVMDSEPKASKLSYIGIWVSGTHDLNHPFTWTACIRYAYSSLITNKLNDFISSFIVILFSSTSRRPEFYICKPAHSKLEFALFNGSSQLIVNKNTNENRCITIDLNQVTDGYQFNLFNSSLNQVFRQDILGQNKILQLTHENYKAQEPQFNLKLAYQNSLNDTSNSSSFLDENELQPRSVNAIMNLKTNRDMADSNLPVINSMGFYKPISTNTLLFNKNGSNTNIAGSYHSVSDISILSDIDNDTESSNQFIDSQSSNTSSSNNLINSNHNLFSSSSVGVNRSIKNKFLSHSDDFEFKNSKSLQQQHQPLASISSQSSCQLGGAGSLSNYGSSEKMKYNQNLYSSSSNTDTSSIRSSSSSALHSPTESYKNAKIPVISANFHEKSIDQFQSNVNPPNIYQQKPINKNLIINAEKTPFENSKSMLFGIPRNSPKPTVTENTVEFNLESPFSNITLNNCEDMSLYQSTYSGSNYNQEISKSNTTNNKNENSYAHILIEQQKIKEKAELELANQILQSKNIPNQLKCNSLASNFSTDSLKQMPPPPVQYSMVSNNPNNLQCSSLSASNFHKNTSLNTSQSLQLASMSTSKINSNQQTFSDSFQLTQNQIDEQQNHQYQINSNINFYYPNVYKPNASAMIQMQQPSQLSISQAPLSISNSNIYSNQNMSHNSSKIQFQNEEYSNNSSINHNISINTTINANNIKDSTKLPSPLSIDDKFLSSTINNKPYQNQSNIQQQKYEFQTNHESLQPVSIYSFQQQLKNKLIDDTDLKNHSSQSIKHDLSNKYDLKLRSKEASQIDQSIFDETKLLQQNHLSENIFGVALKDLKENVNWSSLDHPYKVDSKQFSNLDLNETLVVNNNNRFNNSVNPSSGLNSCLSNEENSLGLPRLNYVSLFLDECLDKNTSMNTEALAYKYLKNSNTSSKQTNNYYHGNYESSNNLSYYMQASSNQISYFSNETTGNNFFQYYNGSKPNENEITCYNSNLTITESDVNFIPQPYAKLINEANDNSKMYSNASINSDYSNKLDVVESRRNLINSQHNEHDNDESDDDNKNNNEKREDTSESSDGDDEDIWLFKKPSTNSNGIQNTRQEYHEKYGDMNGASKNEKAKNIKQKVNKMTNGLIQQRKQIEKDFSDQDEEIDRDVTHVLDIERLKRLPKLL